MSSGCGTQQNDSKDEPTYAESLELQVFSYPTQPNDGDPQSFVLLPSSLKPENLHSNGNDDKHANKLKSSTSTFCGSIENVSQISKTMQTSAYNKSCEYPSPISHCSKSEHKWSVNGSNSHSGLTIPRLMSDQSINSIANDPDDMFSHQNLRDELLNCEQKELFQFLSDDFDNSHNYFSDTVGYGSAIIDPDTDSLICDSKREQSLLSPARKTSITSNKSNLSYISNSIFETMKQTHHGGSISESIDRKSLNQLKSNENYPHCCDELEPLVQDSEFENIIASFEKELSSIKNSTCSLQRKLSAISRSDSQAKNSLDKSSSTNTYEEILPMRQQEQINIINNNNNNNNNNEHNNNESNANNNHNTENNNKIKNTNNSNNTNNDNNRCSRNSVKLKRRSLEKQMKIDDDFNVSNEIKKICDHIQAPFADNNHHDNKQSISISNLKRSSSCNNGGWSNQLNNLNISPKSHKKDDFHSSLDRIKRTSLIERVDESLLENDTNSCQLNEHQQTTYTHSERLPRKYLNADMNIESLSLKSTGSYEHLVCHTDAAKEAKRIRFQKNSEENDLSVNAKDANVQHADAAVGEIHLTKGKSI